MGVFGRVADLPIYACAAFVKACEVALQMQCQLLRGFGEGGSGALFGSERERPASDFEYLDDDELSEILGRLDMLDGAELSMED